MRKYKDVWNGKLVQLLELAIDVALAIVILILASQIEHFIIADEWVSWEYLFTTYDLAFLQIGVYGLIAGVCFRVYKTSVIKKKHKSVLFSTIVSLFIINFVAEILVLINKQKDFFVGEEITPLCIFAAQVFIFSFYKYFLYIIFFKYNRRTALIYGKKEDVLSFAKEFYQDKSNFTIIKYLVFEESVDSLTDGLKKYINDVNDVYLTADIESGLRDLVINYILQRTYKELYFIPKTYEINIQKTSFEQVDDTLVLRARSMHLSFEQRFFKRIFDIICASIGIIIASIPMLIVALAIKINDGGPVLFKQERIKRNSKKFFIYKFRSMKIDADKEKPAMANDSRITKVGKFIRATRLDELPQLFNILKGEMSIVGPRPLIPKEINEAIEKHPDFIYRLNVKPGVTGYAQVNGRYTTEEEEKLRYDLTYVRNYSFWLDIKIILQTIIVIFSKGASRGFSEKEKLEDFLAKNKEKLVEIEEGYEIRCINEEEAK